MKHQGPFVLIRLQGDFLGRAVYAIPEVSEVELQYLNQLEGMGQEFCFRGCKKDDEAFAYVSATLGEYERDDLDEDLENRKACMEAWGKWTGYQTPSFAKLNDTHGGCIKAVFCINHGE